MNNNNFEFGHFMKNQLPKDKETTNPKWFEVNTQISSNNNGFRYYYSFSNPQCNSNHAGNRCRSH